MKATDFNLPAVLKFEPEAGRLMLNKDRMLIFRQEALGTLRKLLGEQLGQELSRALLSQFGFRCGSEDHKTLSKAYTWDTEVDELACGPVIHTWEGIVKATPTVIEFDRAKGSFLMKGTWTNSYEADLHLAEFGRAQEPVCHTLTGYASGWVTSFWGKPMVAVEPKCRGRGDDICEFEIRPADQWGAEAEPWARSLAATNGSLTRELQDRLSVIEAQRAAIAQLSTPIIQVWDGILCLPVVGTVDTARSMEMTERVLHAVVAERARAAIIDITGIEVMDTKTVDHFLKMTRTLALLGAKAIITGISPSVATTLTQLGVELGEVRTCRSLRDALRLLLAEDAAKAAAKPKAS